MQVRFLLPAAICRFSFLSTEGALLLLQACHGIPRPRQGDTQTSSRCVKKCFWGAAESVLFLLLLLLLLLLLFRFVLVGMHRLQYTLTKLYNGVARMCGCLNNVIIHTSYTTHIKIGSLDPDAWLVCLSLVIHKVFWAVSLLRDFGIRVSSRHPGRYQ